MTKFKNEEKILSPDFLDEIKRIREQRGISIEEIAEKTNIKTSYIRAIEDGDLSRLPGGIYNKAFIKSISEFLGVNTKPYERKIDSDQMIKERQVKVELGRPLNASMPSKSTIIACIFGIFILYLVFYGPTQTKQQQINNAVENYKENQIEKTEEKLDAATKPEEKEAITSDLQQKISDDSQIMRKIADVSPIKKETDQYLDKELVLTILAKQNSKIVVKDYYGKIILNKELTPNEAVMLNGSSEYSIATSDINNLSIFMDGVQITDIKNIPFDGNYYTFAAEKLVGIAEKQEVQQIKQEEAVQPEASTSDSKTETENADKTQNNPQGSGR